MLTMFGGKHTFCDSLSRRDFLRAGFLGLGSLSMADLFRSAVCRVRFSPRTASGVARRKMSW